MTREEFLEQSKLKQMQIKRLEQELVEDRKSYIEEHKQIKGELPVKIHYVHTDERGYKEEGDAYVTGFDVYSFNYYVYGTNEFQKYHGLVYPVIHKLKKDGGKSRYEHHYSKFGTFKFWEIGKEETVYELDFGR